MCFKKRLAGLSYRDCVLRRRRLARFESIILVTYAEQRMNSLKPSATPADPTAKPESPPPIKLPNPPDDTQPETPKVGSRDAPGG
jgi:hypothetical protein